MTGAAALLLALATPVGVDVLVVPPEGSGVPAESAWVGEAIGALLPRALNLAGTRAIEPADRARAQAALDLPQTRLTRATSIRVAEALGTSRLLVGSYSLEAADLRLSLRLLDAERATLSAPFVASGPLSNLPELLYALAWDVALTGPSAPTLAREAFLARRPQVRLEALQAHGRGLLARETAARQKFMRRALQLEPGFQEARLALGRLLLEAREFSAAAETLAEVPDEAPQSRRAGFLRGVALLELGRYAEADALLAQLAAADATAAVLNNRALALLRAGAAGANASALLRKALEQDPSAPEVRFNLGWALLWEGDAEAAAFHLGGVVQADPLDGHARVVLSWAQRRAGRNQEAQESWKGVLVLAPTYDVLLKEDLTRRFERILPSERRVQAAPPRSVSEVAATLVDRGERLAASGQPDAALHELNRAVYLDPYAPNIHFRLARVHRQRGDRELAINELRMALWSQDDAGARAELALLLQEAGRHDEARTEAEKVLRLDPANQTARKLLSLGAASNKKAEPNRK